MVVVTRHAEKRIRERLGIRKRRVQEHAEKVFRLGVPRREVAGKLHRFLKKEYHVADANNIRVFGLFVYVFDGATLITVFDVPQKMRGQALAANKKRVGGGRGSA